MYEEELKKIGLTSGEARAYSALLELESSTVGPIVKKSGIAYSRIYEVLERLIEKGLVSFIIKEKTKYFQPLEPFRLKEYLENKEKELNENKQFLNELVPLLNKLNKNSDEQKAEVFIGEKGIATAYEILLKQSGEILFLYVHNPEYDEKVNEFYFGIWNQLRKLGTNFKNKIKMRGVINRQSFRIKMNRNLPSYLEQRIVDFPIPGNVDIGEDSVLILTWGEKPTGILIKSKEVAGTYKKYFESIWSLGKKDR